MENIIRNKLFAPIISLFLIFITEANDIMQYVFGKLFGKHKILPKVSPNKTWEGFIGGVLSTTAIGYFMGFLTPLSSIELILISFCIAIFGFMGDAIISAVIKPIFKGIKGIHFHRGLVTFNIQLHVICE